MTVFTVDEIQEQLKGLPDWTYDNGMIGRCYVAATFNRAIGFVVQVAILADTADHHPDIDIRYNKVIIRLSTHSAKGITAKDIDLARNIESAFGE